MQWLSDDVAVVTGGASGIGREIACTFAEHGADVVVADVRDTPRGGGTPTVERITAKTDARSTYVECDVTEVSDLERAVAVASEFGGLTCMVNSAGIISNTDALETTEAEYERVFDVNVKGTFFGCQLAAQRMVERGQGSIINISSKSGLTGSGTSPIYSASKGAVRLLTYALASQLGPEGIRVNAIHPGIIRTSLVESDLGATRRLDDEDYRDSFLDTVPSRRLGEPSDVANAALFLASELGAYVNAESLIVDGGRTNTH